MLLLERRDHPGYWQSVTGSSNPNETLQETAVREVAEETGLDALQFALSDWQVSNDYEIYNEWRHRYAPGVTINREHVFGLELPEVAPVSLSPKEHIAFLWLPAALAAEKVFSPSNRAAIENLMKRSP